MIESQGGSGAAEGGGGAGDGQSGQAASTALIEKILSEEPRWQGTAFNPRKAKNICNSLV